jgi:hypothetical protein
MIIYDFCPKKSLLILDVCLCRTPDLNHMLEIYAIFLYTHHVFLTLIKCSIALHVAYISEILLNVQVSSDTHAV